MAEPARTDIVPIVVYEDIAAAQAYLVEVFGFTAGELHCDGDGTVVHGEVYMGAGTVWMHQVSPAHQMASPGQADDSHGGLSVLVDDVDAHYARSVAAGAHVDGEPSAKDYGLREYGARDLEHHRWWFSTPLP